MAGGDRDRLWSAFCSGPVRYEAAGGLLEREPSRILHAGDLRAQRSWRTGRGVADAQSRAFDRGAVRTDRHALRAVSHTGDLRSGRNRPADAAVDVFHATVHFFEHRPTGLERL